MGGFAGLGPKARPFLKALGFYQSREWFAENKGLYEADLRLPLEALVVDLDARLVAEGLRFRGSPKASIFRINRDIRFSKDKNPYKTHVGVALSPSGPRTDWNVLLYLHFGAQEAHVSCGFWQPEPARLVALRRKIETCPDAFRNLVAALATKGLAFAEADPKKRLSTGFEVVSEPDIAAAVKQRNFIVSRNIPHERWYSATILDDVIAFARDACPLVDCGYGVAADPA